MVFSDFEIERKWFFTKSRTCRVVIGRLNQPAQIGCVTINMNHGFANQAISSIDPGGIIFEHVGFDKQSRPILESRVTLTEPRAGRPHHQTTSSCR